MFDKAPLGGLQEGVDMSIEAVAATADANQLRHGP